MRQEMKAIYELLLEQKSVQENLLNLAFEKRQVIVKNDTERLSEIVSLEQRGISNINNIERRRKKLLPGLSKLLTLPEDEMNLSKIIEQATPAEKEPFRVLQKEILSLIKSQAELNRLNQQLIETQIEYTDTMLGVLVGDEDPINNFYGDDGKASLEKKRAAGLFDRQI